jgi:hypothetical protein
MLRDNLREIAVPCELFQDAGGCFLGLFVSGGAGLEAVGLSFGRVCCLRREAGLEEGEAVRRPGDEDQWVSRRPPHQLPSSEAPKKTKLSIIM